MIVDDEDTTGGIHHPHATVGDELAQAIADEELVEPRLPDAGGVSAARHIPSDEKKVAVTMHVVSREVANSANHGGITAYRKRPPGWSMPGRVP